MTNDELLSYVDFVPKQSRSRARLLLQALQKHIHLDDDGRVLYDNTTGSPLIDLVTYWTTDNVSRPLDADIFGQLIHKIGVPKQAIVKSKQNNLVEQRWLKLFN